MANTTDMANAIRALAMDAVQQANSGHPGAPMGMADMAVALWSRHLKHNPKDPKWVDRDRFVLSNGHASMLLYSLIHLAGIKDRDEHGNVVDRPSLPLEELKKFRQLGSRTPGHPEQEATSGIETTTGPLGQGFATAVGMAMGERFLAASTDPTVTKALKASDLIGRQIEVHTVGERREFHFATA